MQALNGTGIQEVGTPLLHHASMGCRISQGAALAFPLAPPWCPPECCSPGQLEHDNDLLSRISPTQRLEMPRLHSPESSQVLRLAATSLLLMTEISIKTSSSWTMLWGSGSGRGQPLESCPICI